MDRDAGLTGYDVSYVNATVALTPTRNESAYFVGYVPLLDDLRFAQLGRLWLI